MDAAIQHEGCSRLSSARDTVSCEDKKNLEAARLAHNTHFYRLDMQQVILTFYTNNHRKVEMLQNSYAATRLLYSKIINSQLPASGFSEQHLNRVATQIAMLNPFNLTCHGSSSSIMHRLLHALQHQCC